MLAIDLDPAERAILADARPRFEAYVASAPAVTDLAPVDIDAATAALPAFERSFLAVRDLNDAAIAALERRQAMARSTESSIQDAAIRNQVIGAIAICFGLLLLTLLLGRAIVRRLQSLADVAHRVVAGDLAARAQVGAGDEVGRLATAFNEMADSLTAFVDQLEAEAQRDGFGTRLLDALEMADEEEAAHAVVERAMAEVADGPMELLLSDSSQASLAAVVVSSAGAPGCPVKSPFSCVAVRRGVPVVFETSEALNACPALRDRPQGACSAACVPVTFMGRALGVLHATGPEHEPLGDDQLDRLTTLATQAGARIGTVRAFQKTQLQAATDALTGLMNRRTLENRLREMSAGGRSFALAMCDLDHFKKLNDTYGHEMGDRALRLFARVVSGAVRDGDLVARHGGEEFVIVLPEANRHFAATILDRIRTQLAAAHLDGQPPFTASFGVADSGQADTIDAVTRLADTALYQAKEAGRDRVAIAGGSTSVSAGEHVIAEAVAGVTGGVRAATRFADAVDEPDPGATGTEIR